MKARSYYIWLRTCYHADWPIQLAAFQAGSSNTRARYMSEFFDVYTLIYLVIAVVVLLRLRRTLGQRTGHEKPRHQSERYSGVEDRQANGDGRDRDGKVVPLPGAKRQSSASPAKRDWGDHAKPRSARAKVFNSFAEIDPGFDPGEFLEGARSAYEMIVTAFADGDRKTLQSLLSPDVYDEFLEAISAREKRDEKVESSFVSIDKVTLKDAKLSGSTARLVVEFVSQMITATRDDDNKVIDGDPSQIVQIKDVWTFARDLTSSNPNWRLVATGDND